jgi:hypothetical protein
VATVAGVASSAIAARPSPHRDPKPKWIDIVDCSLFSSRANARSEPD